MTHPPLFGRLLLRLWRLGSRRQEIESDLVDLMERRARTCGLAVARRRYVADALSLYRIQRVPDVIGDPEPTRGFDTMVQDILFALRLFRRHAGLLSLTVGGLALAIGVATAVLGIVNAVAGQGTGISAPENVFRIASIAGAPDSSKPTGRSRIYGEWTYEHYGRLVADAPSLQLVAGHALRADVRRSRETSQPIAARYLAVSGNYFDVLGLRAVVGRTLTPSDDRAGARNIVVSEGFWRNVLGADRAIVGQALIVDSETFTVVGIVHRRHGRTVHTDVPPAFWMTLRAHEETWLARPQADVASAQGRWNPPVEVLGRLSPGRTRAQAESEVASVSASLALRANGTSKAVVQFEATERDTRRSVRLIVAVFVVIVALVVLLACANVANLLLASAASRRREIGTRLAIGASRGRLMRQLMTESLMLSGLALAVGLLVAHIALPALAARIQLPHEFDVSLDARVFVVIAGLSLVIGVLTGLAPARWGCRTDVTTTLKSDQAGAPAPLPRAWLRSLLIGGQAAISVLLLVMAALLTRSLMESTFVDPGFDINRLITASISTRPAKGGIEGADLAAIREAVLRVPHVEAAAFASTPPFTVRMSPQSLNGLGVSRNDTSPEYFDTIGIRLLRGRVYTADEVRSGARVAVISASLAEKVWGREDVVGEDMARVWGRPAERQGAGTWRTPAGTQVIGVVADITAQLAGDNAPTIYMPLAEGSIPRLVVRAQRDTGNVSRGVVDALDDVDPTLRPIVASPAAFLRQELERPRMIAELALAVGAIALMLAAIGLVGVTSFVVEQRSHEMTVRRALGASEREVITLILRDNLRPVAIGLIVGLLASLAGGHIVRGALYGTNPRDPVALLAATLVLVAVAVVATLVPSRRAGRVDPAQLLKQG